MKVETHSNGWMKIRISDDDDYKLTKTGVTIWFDKEQVEEIKELLK
jgi:hypothetical protein